MEQWPENWLAERIWYVYLNTETILNTRSEFEKEKEKNVRLQCSDWDEQWSEWKKYDKVWIISVWVICVIGLVPTTVNG